MKMTWFARPAKFKLRMLLMLLGVSLQGLGLSLLIRINFGTDPCSAFTQGVIAHVPLSFGTAQVLCHMINFIIVMRYDMSRIGFGTIGNMVCLGYISDFFGWIWDSIAPEHFFEGMPVRVLILVPALCDFILGAANDSVPFIISQHVHRFSFRAIRMAWDICFVTAGAILGGDVGIVTVAMALFLGSVIGIVGKKLELWLNKDEK